MNPTNDSTPPPPAEREHAGGTGELEAFEGRQFGTFQGVFRPTILTILGVMMYLREGWLVGNAGLFGAILVILMAYLITGATALSLSSVTSNIRVGAGGVFSIISQSLGLEVGGSIGIPLYLAQGMSAAMYMYGFSEAWQYIFPGHSQALVLVALFVATFALSCISAALAFRVQMIILVCVVVALTSMWMGLILGTHTPIERPVLWGDFEDGRFWYLFAVFFPAATGIMVGASMSGNLRNPRKSIPRGTVSAWAVSLVVYLSLAVWYALMAEPDELRGTMTIAMEHAYWEEAVLIGVLASCLSAALSSMVAAPRVLQALGASRIVPCSSFFEQLRHGEPRAASLFTAALVAVTLVLGDLNRIAVVLTMFFLMAYFTINVVLVIEQSLGLISFRPEFRIPRVVPIVGSIMALAAIVIINPVVGLLAVAFSIGIYGYLDHKQLATPWETVHSGLFLSIANWAAKKASAVDQVSMKRSWKPDLLVAVERAEQLDGYFRLLRALVYPHGSVHVLGMRRDGVAESRIATRGLIRAFQEENIVATSATLDASRFQVSLADSVAVLNGTFFRPNTIFTSCEGRDDNDLRAMVEIAKANTMGVVLLMRHPEAGFGKERTVNLWIRDQSPDWELGLELVNMDYAVLLGYQLQTNWDARLRLLSVVENPEFTDMARNYLGNLMELARMAHDIDIHVESGVFVDVVRQAPKADLNIFGLSERPSLAFMRSTVQDVGSSCLFVRDSGIESALA